MALTFIFLFAATCYGWGRLAARVCYRHEHTPVAYDLALGLAVLNVLGGVLNLLKVAVPFTLHAITLAGVGATLLSVLKPIRSRQPNPSMPDRARMIIDALVPTAVVLVL